MVDMLTRKVAATSACFIPPAIAATIRCRKSSEYAFIHKSISDPSILLPTAVGHWGWRQTDGWLRFVLAFGVPLIAAILWATFRVPNDPGVPPVAVPGIVRLALELGFFAIAIWALFATDATTLGWILSGAVALHYIT